MQLINPDNLQLPKEKLKRMATLARIPVGFKLIVLKTRGGTHGLYWGPTFRAGVWHQRVWYRTPCALVWWNGHLERSLLFVAGHEFAHFIQEREGRLNPFFRRNPTRWRYLQNEADRRGRQWADQIQVLFPAPIEKYFALQEQAVVQDVSEDVD